MFVQPDIDPVFIQLGPLALHWYGMMYLLGLASAWLLGRYRAANHNWQKTEVGDLVFMLFLGAVLGGRIGYTLFYQFSNLISNPLFIIGYTGSGFEWAGMSFHGGLLGVLVAAAWYARQSRHPFWQITDFIAPLVPLTLLFGRIGNFINGELWGRVTDAPWGVLFRQGGPLPRHPSQLYEAFLEGVVLFIILWWFSRKPRPTKAVSGLFLIGYGVFRFAVEFVREPDAHLGYLAFNWFTMGMLLCVPMILFGCLLLGLAYRNKSDPILGPLEKN